MGQNLDIFDIKIDDEDMRCLNSLDRNVRICDFIESINSLDYPFSQEFWKGIFREEFLVWRLASLV